jgi:hypothetical protein
VGSIFEAAWTVIGLIMKPNHQIKSLTLIRIAQTAKNDKQQTFTFKRNLRKFKHSVFHCFG